MSKLIMWNLMTLDGMFDGPKPWDLTFHEYAWGEELRQSGMSPTLPRISSRWPPCTLCEFDRPRRLRSAAVARDAT